MSCFARGTSSVSACGSVFVNQVTWVYEVTNLSDALYGVYFIFFIWPIRAGPTFRQRCVVRHVSRGLTTDEGKCAKYRADDNFENV